MSPASDLLQLALNLRAISRDDGSIDAAQVRVIGLDEIRAAAGDKWPRMRERVRDGSMQILSRFVTGQDVIVPAGDGFLVILAEGAAGANQARCQAMREALLSFYLGDEALQTLRPEVTARSLSADGFADLIASNLGEGGGIPACDTLLRGDIAEARVFRRANGGWLRAGFALCAPRRRDAGLPMIGISFSTASTMVTSSSILIWRSSTMLNAGTLNETMAPD